MYPVIWTDNLPAWQGGVANGPVIRIRPKYREDKGIYQHELCHVRQWFCTLGLHSLLYLWRPYRLWSEAQAYAKQMYYPRGDGTRLSLNDAAKRLASPNYNLNITVGEAMLAITKEQ